ncbi:Oxygen-evolving enhancer protein 3-1, chloroplastic [Zea mays]|uniref:Oxygen-evolving enhancer protein 3-1 n=2 Tax=Zea mays TaxID=4577 RepID=B6SRD4_MAIZE|nr:oxygen-evolving enhancer protein 3-1 [Zea mays]PWZ38793.1 Oxygen-evolving enhancer protein 3-1, chloroplastic [Zea mays]|eukprot:NP_001288549.1 oxygen-evolving enhancer protein 3-1, chloroplastic-like [Zea mays]
MAQTMASMTGLSQGVLPSRRAANRARTAAVVRASAEAQAGRRAVLGLVATGIVGGALSQAVHAETVKTIKIGAPPPPSGGLPGTLNSDQARDFDLPLKERFYLQPLPPAEAVARVKTSAQDIINLKPLIDKKAWPYVQNDLRLRASYLRYDLKTVIASKPKEEKQSLKELTGKLFSTIDDLDHAAKIKSTPEAEKYFAATKDALGDVLAKLA